MRILPILVSGSLSGLPLSVWAAASGPALASSSPSGVGSLLQVMLALGFILLLIVGAAWLVRRFSLLPQGLQGPLKVVSGVMVGPRERVVVVQVDGQWLVLGVTSQQINLLHTLSEPPELPAATPVAPAFAQWLQAALAKRGMNAQSDGGSDAR
ncbi:flagellar biosynthetic protein FliO [Chitinibacter sp. ZOR0017]|uniref:flagellar biosynthetic protein FliO n=1 Tax=Chitinibacter sp. ZOR0017 TaxID=1339254 RepID=UPI00069259E0|nr:flagellar biosynthetic protein FliO [Chitinibacter sp. ZOR0017]